MAEALAGRLTPNFSPKMIDRSNEYARLREAAVESALHFSNAEVRSNIQHSSNTEVRKKGFELRDALLYRFQHLNFHERFLHQLDLDSKELARQKVPAENSQGFMRLMTQRQRFVFDDLLFGSMSAFDYLGGLVMVLAQGNASRKARWKNAYNWAKHDSAGRGDNRIHNTTLAELIIHEEETWIRRMYSYRSSVIHDRTEDLAGSIRWTEAIDRPAVLSSVEAYAPAGFAKSLKLDLDREQIPIVLAAEHLLDRAYASSTVVLEALSTQIKARAQL